MDDERRRQIIVLVAVLSVLRSLLAECVDSCGEFLLQQFRGVVAALDGRGQRNPPTVWTFNRPNLFLESTLLASYNDAAFKSRMRVCPSTFEYLCRLLAPDLKKNDTQMRKAVSVDKRISLALSRLATGNLLKDIGDTFGVGTTTVQRAVMEFCVAVEKRLKPLCIKWPHPSRMEKLASEFEALRGIPLVVGAIDGSYLPIIAPFKNPQDYYNRKGFHAVILQLIVSAKKYIWDYDVGWCGSMHDSNVLKHSGAGVRIRDGHLL